MPFEVQGSGPLNATVSLRLTAAEKLQLQEDAQLAGLSVSALIRRQYFGRKIVARTDVTMIRELRRIGGLLKHIWSESQGAYSQETKAALDEVKNFIKRLSHDR